MPPGPGASLMIDIGGKSLNCEAGGGFIIDTRDRRDIICERSKVILAISIVRRNRELR